MLLNLKPATARISWPLKLTTFPSLVGRSVTSWSGSWSLATAIASPLPFSPATYSIAYLVSSVSGIWFPFSSSAYWAVYTNPPASTVSGSTGFQPVNIHPSATVIPGSVGKSLPISWFSIVIMVFSASASALNVPCSPRLNPTVVHCSASHS